MLKRLLGLTAAAAAMFAAIGTAQAAWPERPITIIVPYSAGGGTDATGRFFAAGLKPILGVPVNVVNRTGASGLTGMSAMANAKPDGYTIGLISNAIGRFHWEGQDLSYKTITPLVMYNVDPAGFQVGPSKANIKTFEEAIADMKKDPKGWNLAGGGRLGTWHMSFIELALAFGMDPKDFEWIAAGGAAPSLTELAAGGVDLAPTSLPEAKGLMDAGKIRSLAMMGAERHPTFPDVPTVKEASGIEVVSGSWRGVAAPAGLPDDIRDKLVKALRQVWESEDFRNGMDKYGYGMAWKQGDEFIEHLKKNDESVGNILRAVNAIQ